MTILLLETVDPEALDILSEVDDTVMSSRPDRVDDTVDLGRVTAIVTRGLGRVDRALLDACPNLQVVARCGTGLDNVDTEHARALGVPVVFAPGLNAAAVAEHTLMLLLMIRRGGYRSAIEVRADNWPVRSSLSCDDLRDSTLGVLGYGRVGTKVTELARAFGMKTAIYDPNDQRASTHDDVESLLPGCDAVTLHLPLTDQTRQLMNDHRIGLMKPGGVLINTSRGQVVDSTAVVRALDAGHLLGYGADVAEQEPPDHEDPLVHHANAVFTPHVASLTRRTYREMCLYTVRNAAAVLQNQHPAVESVFG